MKGIACLVFALVVIECTNAQDYSRIDSLSILFQVYNMSEFEKGLFNGVGARDTSLYIMYKPMEKDSVVHSPTHEKYAHLNIYFFRRVDIIGYRLTHWMVIDSFEIADSKANVLYKIITSSDSWIEKKDEVLSVGNIKLELQNGKWVIVNRKIKRN